MRTLLFPCFWLAAVTAASAQQAALATGTPPVVILFVGNSYTMGAGSTATGYHKDRVTNEIVSKPADSTDPADRSPDKSGKFGGVPAIFKELADEAGLPCEVHAELSGGKSLEWHYTNALATIAQAKWNIVVLQGFSTEPLPAARGGKPDNFIHHAILLEQAIHGANAAAKVYLYETFPRSDEVYPAKGSYHDATVDAMAADLHAGFQQAYDRDGHIEDIAPAGSAWRKVFAAGLAQLDPYLPPEPGKFNLWAVDNHHASAYGTYLNSLVIFGTITRRDVTTFGAKEQAAHDLGIEPETAVKLQAIADQTVKAGSATRR